MAETQKEPTRLDIELPPEGGGAAVYTIDAEQAEAISVKTEQPIAVRPDPPAPIKAEPTETQIILRMIERMVPDTTIDLERIDKVLELRNKVLAREARLAFIAALSAAQGEMPEIDKRGKIIIKEKGTERIIQSTPYALWEDTNAVLKPILARHDLVLSFRSKRLEDGSVETTAILEHVLGHEERTTLVLPCDRTGSKNDVQAIGSSFSYGKRYTATALLNITTRGEDDDGKAGGAKTQTADDLGYIDTEQLDTLRHRVVQVGANPEKFCDYLGIPTLEEMPASMFKRAIDELDGYERKVKAARESKKANGKK